MRESEKNSARKREERKEIVSRKKEKENENCSILVHVRHLAFAFLHL